MAPDSEGTPAFIVYADGEAACVVYLTKPVKVGAARSHLGGSVVDSFKSQWI
jgi:hypothetical protein